jgi:hypothetical protein
MGEEHGDGGETEDGKGQEGEVLTPMGVEAADIWGEVGTAHIK